MFKSFAVFILLTAPVMAEEELEWGYTSLKCAIENSNLPPTEVHAMCQKTHKVIVTDITVTAGPHFGPRPTMCMTEQEANVYANKWNSGDYQAVIKPCKGKS